MALRTQHEINNANGGHKKFACNDEESLKTLRSAGILLAERAGWLPRVTSSDIFARRCRALTRAFESISEEVRALKGDPDSEDLLWIRDNVHEFLSTARALYSELEPLANIPHVLLVDQPMPRVVAIAQTFLKETSNYFRESEFAAFCTAFEEITPLEFHEVGTLVPALKLVLLEWIADAGTQLLDGKKNLSMPRVIVLIRTLRDIMQASLSDVLETLVPFEKVLREDPAHAYAAMDLVSRNMYRERVSQIAQRADRTELEVAKEALILARETQSRMYSDPRIKQRECHIGFFLVGEGTTALYRKVGFHPKFSDKFRALLWRYPDDFFIFGIALLTIAITTGTVWLLTSAATSLLLILLSMLLLCLPASQSAVQIMNYLIVKLLPAQVLAKLDFSKDIPEGCTTLVAIPTLLLNEKQVQGLVNALEIRYLGNHHRNLHFALVSDLPDVHEPTPETHPLVSYCVDAIAKLNEKYAKQNSGSFFLFHRHRSYNPRERAWMGWERKRGKIHDLNQLLRSQRDRFPIKVGDLSIIPKIRFVITLDSDTELPAGSAHRMIGTMAHPLNQAITDPKQNIVVAGYGILQPRVEISVKSTVRSRLAAIFAGETGLDPYTRAVSDVYQDLYGEGIFAGKGIYEVDILRQVLEHRFPRNSLLSHDLIEGAYARAGLATDIIVIEDYPSHYSAYNRRKHRWLRGDWQIAAWLMDRVPNESGALVNNPISLISRWKILDNLRRSLVEPATFALLLFGWLVMPHPVMWTVVTICILFLPACFEFCFGIVRAFAVRSLRIARDAVTNLLTASSTILFTLMLLAHQTLLSLDAVARALVRRMITREHLLEWETAAEAELEKRSTAIDVYLNWMPIIAVCLTLTIWAAQRNALWAALPILVLWACSKRMAIWLDASPLEPEPAISAKDTWFLRKSALYIWRYFSEFSNEEHHWLIPDNVEEGRKIQATVSPTNLGLLLNARQVANEFGYLTVPELVELTKKTLNTIASLPKYRGHLFNWYKTNTLEPMSPLFVSSVDSGNLVVSLTTLSQGCIDLLRRPLLSKALTEGVKDHLRTLYELRALSKRALSRYERDLQTKDWLAIFIDTPETDLKEAIANENRDDSGEIAWFREQTRLRMRRVRELVKAYLPWRLPEFATLRTKLEDDLPDTDIPLQQLPNSIAEIERRLGEALRLNQNGNGASGELLLSMLAQARLNAIHLIEELHGISNQAQDFANSMDFSFLLDQQRLLISVGYDAQSGEMQPYYYSLLATEPRTTIFIAIAKEDIQQECWFRLDRPFNRDHGRPVLLSWTGTMFEYLMPMLWMRCYPNTLLDRATIEAVRSQREYADKKSVPWGISESACAKRNDAGDYHYEAFGVPNLALRPNASPQIVVSPYSTFLALSVDRKNALRNLYRMYSLRWFGPYGFYEAADYTNSRGRFGGSRCEIVKCWMAHHMGMSLLSLGNFLCGNIVQHWFHSDRRVQAAELLLQEKPAS